MSTKLKVHSALSFVALVAGANFSFAKVVMPEYILPFGFLLIRVITTAFLLWSFHRLTIREPIKDKMDYLRLFLCALFGVGLNQTLFFQGLSMTSPINAGLIMNLTPILVLIIASVITKERITLLKVSGILLGAAGTILLLLDDDVTFKDHSFLGDLLLIGNATAYGVYLVLIKPLMAKYNAITVVMWVFIMGSLMVIPLGIEEFIIIDWNFPWEVWASIFLVVILTSFLGYLLNAWALRHVNASVVGAYVYLQTVFAVLVALMIGKDAFNWYKLMLTLMIFAGVYLVSKRK
jgi:drug/metabolite transporter (DMT)-like permease